MKYLVIIPLIVASCSGDSGLVGKPIDVAQGQMVILNVSPSVGKSGDIITVTGVGFFPVAIKRIAFGQQEAVVVDSNRDGTQMRLMVPAQDGGFSNPTPIVIDAHDAVSAQLDAGFTYLSNSDCSATQNLLVANSTTQIHLLDDQGVHVQGEGFLAGAVVNIEQLPVELFSVIDNNISGATPVDITQLCTSYPCTLKAKVMNPNGCSAQTPILINNVGVPFEKTYQSLNGESQFGYALVNLQSDLNADQVNDFVVMSRNGISARSALTNPDSAIWYHSFMQICGGYITQAATYNRLTNLGDISGDGVDDLIIQQSDYGLTNNINCFIMGQGAQNDVISRAQTSGLHGLTALGIRDVNQDGKRDVLIARDYYQDFSLRVGQVEIISGNTIFDGNSANNNSIVTLTPVSGESPFGLGESMVNLGDLDGDQYDEILIAARAQGTAGVVYLYSVVYDPVTFSTKFILRNSIRPQQSDIGFGSEMSLVGDLDNDGKQDFIVGAYNALLLGYSTKDLMSGNNPVPLFRATVSTGSQNTFVPQIANAGDVNGDGVGDFMIGLYQQDLPLVDQGRVIVYSGKLGAQGTLTPLFGRNGGASNEWLGFSMSAMGDINNDSIDEILVSGRFSSTPTQSKVYLFNMFSPNVIYPQQF